jgi:hypothetical protein
MTKNGRRRLIRFRRKKGDFKDLKTFKKKTLIKKTIEKK